MREICREIRAGEVERFEEEEEEEEKRKWQNEKELEWGRKRRRAGEVERFEEEEEEEEGKWQNEKE